SRQRNAYVRLPMQTSDVSLFSGSHREEPGRCFCSNCHDEERLSGAPFHSLCCHKLQRIVTSRHSSTMTRSACRTFGQTVFPEVHPPLLYPLLPRLSSKPYTDE